MQVGHDPFARGGFERTCKGPGECHNCGQKLKRVYTYVWVSDDSGRPSIFNQHQADHTFCSFDCFKSYNS